MGREMCYFDFNFCWITSIFIFWFTGHSFVWNLPIFPSSSSSILARNRVISPKYSIFKWPYFTIYFNEWWFCLQSYGGYLSTWVGANDQGNTFKCIVSVAPVTNWLLYDSAYTERYMGMPMENLAGYNVSFSLPLFFQINFSSLLAF